MLVEDDEFVAAKRNFLRDISKRFGNVCGKMKKAVVELKGKFEDMKVEAESKVALAKVAAVKFAEAKKLLAKAEMEAAEWNEKVEELSKKVMEQDNETFQQRDLFAKLFARTTKQMMDEGRSSGALMGEGWDSEVGSR